MPLYRDQHTEEAGEAPASSGVVARRYKWYISCLLTTIRMMSKATNSSALSIAWISWLVGEIQAGSLLCEGADASPNRISATPIRSQSEAYITTPASSACRPPSRANSK